MEESCKLAQPTPLEQTSMVPANVPELHEQSLKKAYQPPKLELIGNVCTATANIS